MLEKLRSCAAQIGSVIVGKELQIRQSMTCLLAGGHRVRAMARSPERLRCRPWGGF